MLSFNELIRADRPVLVDFFATLCGPCKMMQPILSEMNQAVGDQAAIIKVDIDKNPAIARQFQIQGVPTLVIFKNGKIHWRQSGVVPAAQLKKVIEQHI